MYQDAYKYASGIFHPNLGYEQYRIGADGWLWKRVNQTPMFIERMTCFRKTNALEIPDELDPNGPISPRRLEKEYIFVNQIFGAKQEIIGQPTDGQQ